MSEASSSRGSRKPTSPIWDYFEKIDSDEHSNDKRATCKVCFEDYSYSTTITNLKQHLQKKHPEACPAEFLKERESRKNCHQNVTIWGYFTKVINSRELKVARCNICRQDRKFTTTICNLKDHLLKAHPAAYERYLQNLPPDFDTLVDGDNEDDNHNDESDEHTTEMWNYFEQEGSKARCVVCRQLIHGSAHAHLKDHLFVHHPKLLLSIVQQQEEKQEVESNASNNDDNTYTEVVYLERDSSPEDTRITEPPPKITNTFTQKRSKKRTRNSSSSDRNIVKHKKESSQTREEDNELEVFIKYIRCLLKKLPSEVFSKVQVDILKTIMDAQSIGKVSVTDTCSQSILTDIANGSIGNVIRVSEIAPENNLLGNYTVTLAKGEDVDK